MQKGTFVVLDGTDGSGKTVQAKLLSDRLRAEGYAILLKDFPQYGNWSAAHVERYLRGEFGGAHDVSAKCASLFFALDRYGARQEMETHLQQGGIIISNRYVSANKGHQLGKITDEKEMRAFLGWINDLEYKTLGLPVPDVTIFLHMPPAVGQQLVAQKGDRAYLQGAIQDIHEKSLDHLLNAEQAYLFCFSHDPVENWKRIVCSDGDTPRQIEVIHEEVYQLVKKALDIKEP